MVFGGFCGAVVFVCFCLGFFGVVVCGSPQPYCWRRLMSVKQKILGNAVCSLLRLDLGQNLMENLKNDIQ